MITEEPRTRGRSGQGRDARRAARLSNQVVGIPYIQRNLPLWDLLSDEGAETVEANADQILEEVGFEIHGDAEILGLWKEAGADIKGERMHLPKGLARSLCKTAPSSFIQHARNPARSVMMGGDNTVFAPVYGPPFVHDREKGRRYATLEDFQNFVKMAYSLPYFHHSGGTVCEPVDLPVNKRHLDMVMSHIRYSDKAFMGSVTAPSRAADSVEMARLLFGEKFLDENACILALINANSPSVYDATMLGALKVYAKANQPTIVSPFMMAGATGPVGALGVLTQIMCEAMVGVATTQLVRKGCPVIFGAFVTSISMKTGAPSFGGPDAALLLPGAAKLARRLNVPFRSGGSFTSSKSMDAQAASESQNTLMMTVSSGTNFVLHAGGWLEGGLCSSYEKLVIDHDQLGAMHRMAEGLPLDENSQAMDALREVGPNSHFLGAEHTKRNFSTAYYQPAFADTTTFEQWKLEGEPSTAERATKVWKQLLEEYVPPALDPGTEESLEAFMAQRKAAEPDSNV